MAEIERKTVKVSAIFDTDIGEVFEYGEETFGYNTALSFVDEVYAQIWKLDTMYLVHPECRHLSTKSKKYRNILLGSYLIIYRIGDSQIEVLRIVCGYRSVSKIKAARKITL